VRRLLIWAALGLFVACGARAQTGPLAGQFCAGATAQAAAARTAIGRAAEAPPAELAQLAALLQAATARSLRCWPDGTVAIQRGDALLDPDTMAPRPPPAGAPRTPLLGLAARGVVETAQAAVALLAAPAPADRLAAIRTLERRLELVPTALLDRAAAAERDPAVVPPLAVLVETGALRSPDPLRRASAIAALAADPTQRALTRLEALKAEAGYADDPRVAAALETAIERVRGRLRIAAAITLLYNALSAASVLFLAALGLAVTFGLLGVINLAQGEFIMLGAYTAWCVQAVLRIVAPGLLDWSLLLAIPVVFCVVGAVGMLIEETVIRRLYRQPLTTLLATWAISLLLVNLIRVGFGTQNLRFDIPFWLDGGVRLMGDALITWNRLFAIIVAIAAFAGTLALLRFTAFGLFIRAVTQNREMAGCCAVPVRRVDRLAFGFGAGLAGLGGLALAPIYNVNPQMGAGFTIDAFMVVVLGGVGSLAGTALASLAIGLVNVGIEPFYGAVAAKVCALLLVILLIQVRPEGFIALKGRR